MQTTKKAKAFQKSAQLTARELISLMQGKLADAQNLYVAQALENWHDSKPTLRDLQSIVRTASKHIDVDADGNPTVFGNRLG